jgi:hypothetical protein
VHHPSLQGKEGSTGTGLDADLRVEALDVIVGSFGRDIELPGRLLRGVARSDQAQDFDLSGRQPRDALSRRSASGLPGDREDSLDGLAAELTVLDRVAKSRGGGGVG